MVSYTEAGAFKLEVESIRVERVMVRHRFLKGQDS